MSVRLLGDVLVNPFPPCPLCRAVEYTDYTSAEGKTPDNVYDSKQSDGEVPVMLELWRMQSTL